MSPKTPSVKASTGMFLLGTLGMSGIVLTMLFGTYVLRPLTKERRMKNSIAFAESLYNMESELGRNKGGKESALNDQLKQ